MVVFVDLEDESEPDELLPRWNAGREGLTLKSLVIEDEARPNPNKNVMSEALGCYPIISSIASHIDLNTLDALSSTCRQIRVNLLQFRAHLIASTLHCENEGIAPNPEHTFRFRARAADWYFVDAGRDALSVGKVGDCARDMVGSCRRCARVICRNCTIKPPAPVLMRQRHRRLCTACQHAPLSTLTTPHCSALPSDPVTKSALQSAVCTCPSAGVYLCQPCGRSLKSADDDYEGIWKWRTRYLPSLGGLGVGIGEGNRGVPCGRGGQCVAAREVEQETDCDAEDAREFDSRAASPSSSPGSVGSGAQGQGHMGPGYARHEIEGIGGVVKRKRVKMVKVGACVPEYSDEKAQGRFLVREMEGRARAWCGWCWRVVPGAKDAV